MANVRPLISDLCLPRCSLGEAGTSVFDRHAAGSKIFRRRQLGLQFGPILMWENAQQPALSASRMGSTSNIQHPMQSSDSAVRCSAFDVRRSMFSAALTAEPTRSGTPTAAGSSAAKIQPVLTAGTSALATGPQTPVRSSARPRCAITSQ